MNTTEDTPFTQLDRFLNSYFDAFYQGNTNVLTGYFDERAHVYFTDGINITDWSLKEYFEIIDGRESAAQLNLERHDVIHSIQLAGEHTALASISCSMHPKYFTDYLTIMYADDSWRIISKSSYVELKD